MNDNPDAPGEGDEPYLTPVQANKIVASLLNPRKRFPFNETVARFAIRQTIKNIKSPDPRVSNVAVANLIKMERLNQTDDLARLAAAMGVLQPKASPQPINVGVTVGVQFNQTALEQKAAQYGLTESRLAGMLEANEQHTDNPTHNGTLGDDDADR